MTVVPPTSAPFAEWGIWAPPLDPPDVGGLPLAYAQAIADQWWYIDPHYCAGLQWDAYAGMLTPTAAVSSVSTGGQSVTYEPPTMLGDFGAAVAKANWHFARSVHGQGGLISLQLARADRDAQLTYLDLDDWAFEEGV